MVKVLDFGLVKSVGEDDAHLTADGALTGHAGLHAARARRGRPGRRDLRPLLARLRGVLDADRAGPVFAGDPMAMLIHHVRTPPPRPSDVLGAPVPEPVERVVLDCLAKEPSRRPASALELDRRLAEVERAAPWRAGAGRAVVARAPPAALGPGRRAADRSDDFLSLQSLD